MTNEISLGLVGASGKMGKFFSDAVKASQGLAIAWAPSKDELARLNASQICAKFNSLDAIVDFSLPEAMTSLIRTILSKKPSRWPAVVIGSTGWSDDQNAILNALAAETAVLRGSNFSTGVQLLRRLVLESAASFHALGFEAAIVESHHSKKRDAPSGTALLIQKAWTDGLRQFGGETPLPPQIASLRIGQVIGEHEIQLHGPSEVIKISHSAHDRSLFAKGALRVARWLVEKRRAGFYAQGWVEIMESVDNPNSRG